MEARLRGCPLIGAGSGLAAAFIEQETNFVVHCLFVAAEETETRYYDAPNALDSWMYRRPWFYGFPRRLKTIQERQEYLDMLRRNESPWLKISEALNRVVNNATEKN